MNAEQAPRQRLKAGDRVMTPDGPGLLVGTYRDRRPVTHGWPKRRPVWLVVVVQGRRHYFNPELVHQLQGEVPQDG